MSANMCSRYAVTVPAARLRARLSDICGRPGRDSDAGRQTLDVDGEIDARQGLVEIVDVEEDDCLRAN